MNNNDDFEYHFWMYVSDDDDIYSRDSYDDRLDIEYKNQEFLKDVIQDKETPIVCKFLDFFSYGLMIISDWIHNKILKMKSDN